MAFMTQRKIRSGKRENKNTTAIKRDEITEKRCHGITVLAALAGLLIGTPFLAHAADITCTTSLNNCGATLGNPDSQVIVVNTTENINIKSPVLGFGLLTNYFGFKLNDITITTAASQADAVRINTIGSYVFAKKLSVTTTGSSADGINVASDPQSPGNDAVVYVSDDANIAVKAGTAVRVNNFYDAGSNSVAILPDGSTISVTGNGTATQGTSTISSDSYGYGVYAGNRRYDMNAIGTQGAIQGQNNNAQGNSYAFIGSGSTVSTGTKNGHAVYANKGGLVQLGDGVNVSTANTGAYALYAATEQQGSYTANVRPGYIFLEGGATLRATNTPIFMQASGVGSVIANQSMHADAIVEAIVPNGDWTYWWKNKQFQRLDPDNTGLLDKTKTTPTKGVFDVAGIMDAIGGGAIDLNMTDGSRFVGSTNVHLENATASTLHLDMGGSASQWSINANSTLNTLNLGAGATLQPWWNTPAAPTAYTLQGSVTSAGGILHLSDGAANDTLTIKGSYAGSGAAPNGARLRLDTVLGDDSSPSDKLALDGSATAATGVTTIAIANVGGLGALTTGNGILLVDAQNGATTDPGAFALDGGSISVGGYTYALYRGSVDASAPDSWFLRSTRDVTLQTITLTKLVTGEAAGYVAGSTFPITVQCTDSGGTTVYLAKDGTDSSFQAQSGDTCTVTEGALPSPASGYVYDAPSIAPGSFTVPDGGQTVTVTNTLRAWSTFLDSVLLNITKTANLSALPPNGTIVYTITVSNAGTNAASDVVVSDPVPAELVSFDWTCSGAACPHPSGTGAINETIAALAANAAVTYTVTAMATSTPTTAPDTFPSACLAAGGCASGTGTGTLGTVTVTNTASVTSDSGTSRCAPAGTPVPCQASFTTASGGGKRVPIPTLSTALLALLAGLLGSSAAASVLRTRRAG